MTPLEVLGRKIKKIFLRLSNKAEAKQNTPAYYVGQINTDF